jgi:hypothetical protein
MEHLIDYRQKVKFWTIYNYYGIKGWLSAEGHMCQKYKNKSIRVLAIYG